MNQTNSKDLHSKMMSFIYHSPHVLPEHSIHFWHLLSNSTRSVVTHILLSHLCLPACHHVPSGYYPMLHKGPCCCCMYYSFGQLASPLCCGLVVEWFVSFL